MKNRNKVYVHATKGLEAGVGLVGRWLILCGVLQITQGLRASVSDYILFGAFGDTTWNLQRTRCRLHTGEVQNA